MRRTVATCCLLFAWICANGAIWDAVQVAAWSRMFWHNAQTSPMAQALERTFDGSKPCSLCVAVVKAKASEREQAPVMPELGAPKLALLCDSVPPPAFAPTDSDWNETLPEIGPARVHVVPVPPPRAV